MLQSDFFERPMVAGMAFRPDLITREAEAALIARIDAVDLTPFRFQGWLGKRVTASFGWRRSNPSLPEHQRAALVNEVMAARRAVGATLRTADKGRLAEARAQVDRAKVALGERGPVWWDDGAPDLNQHMAKNTGYAGWLDGPDNTR